MDTSKKRGPSWYTMPSRKGRTHYKTRYAPKAILTAPRAPPRLTVRRPSRARVRMSANMYPCPEVRPWL